LYYRDEKGGRGSPTGSSLVFEVLQGDTTRSIFFLFPGDCMPEKSEHSMKLARGITAYNKRTFACGGCPPTLASDFQ
jgi:hypothetical protein